MRVLANLFLMMVITMFQFNLAIAQNNQDMVQSKAPVTHHVAIKNFAFVPDTIDVAIGDKIVWTNTDGFPHNIVNSRSQEILSQTLDKGDEFSYIVNQDLNYECGFHPSMRGNIQLSRP